MVNIDLSKHILVRFVTEDDIISAAIRRQTWSAFSHVEFITDDMKALGAHHEGGVQIRALDSDKFTKEEWYAIPCTNDQKIAAMTFALQQVGKPYDTEAIFGMLVRKDWSNSNAWFCSELVTAACLHAGIIILHITDNVDRITPRDDYMSPLLIPVPVPDYKRVI